MDTTVPQDLERRLRSAIASVPDFPKPGIMFRDVTPLLADVELRQAMIDTVAKRYKHEHVTAVAGPEARGFIFGVMLADRLGVAFVPIRKPGKLPRAVYQQRYELEYGSDELQIHQDALGPDDRVVIFDDLLATGGTAEAACRLIEKTGATIVENVFVVELPDLGGRARIASQRVHPLVSY